jgi:hypothetical protein
VPGKPAIHTRAEWGARKPGKFDNPPVGKLRGAVVHHTENANNYTQAQVPSLIYNIQGYHMGARGWADIGYNFLVDRFGGIWEGRADSIAKNVVGAHAAPFNTGSVGVSVMGSFVSENPPQAAVDAVGRVIAWKLAMSGVLNLKGTVVYPEDPAKKPRDVVTGHGNVNATSCPGAKLAAKLPALRDYRYTGSGVPAPDPTPQAPFVQVVLTPDMSGNRRGDVVGVDAGGMAWLYWFTSGNTLGAPAKIGSGFGTWRLFAPGDWDGNGRADVVGVTKGGEMFLFKGNGTASLSNGVKIGWGWDQFDVVPTGDLTGDGKPDMLAVKKATGELFVYAGDGKGGWLNNGRGVKAGWGWQAFQLHAAGDVNRDGKADILSVAKDGALWFYPGLGNGQFGRKYRVGWGWSGYTLASGADLTGDGLYDIAGRSPDGKLYMYRALGGGQFAPKVQIASGW